MTPQIYLVTLWRGPNPRLTKQAKTWVRAAFEALPAVTLWNARRTGLNVMHVLLKWPDRPSHRQTFFTWHFKFKGVCVPVTFEAGTPREPRMPSCPEHLHMTLQHSLSDTVSCRENSRKQLYDLFLTSRFIKVLYQKTIYFLRWYYWKRLGHLSKYVCILYVNGLLLNATNLS